MTLRTIKILLVTTLFFSCGSPGLDEGKDSLLGSWEVYEVFYQEGTRTTLGISPDTSFTKSGLLGNFDFTKEELIYNYDYDDASLSGQSTWTLSRAKVNCGFTQCERYTLEFDTLALNCVFGDDTADAEKDATMLQLSFESTAIGPYEYYVLSLRK